MTPDITPLPIAPQRTDLPATFSQRADSFVAALQPFRDELVSAIDWQNTTFIATENAKNAAESAKGLAETARDDSQSARDASIAARDKSQDWAEAPINTQVETGKYSALHWSDQSQTYASAAQSAAGVPALAGNAGFALRVNDLEDGVEWKKVVVNEVGQVLLSAPNVSYDKYLELDNSSIVATAYPQLKAFADVNKWFYYPPSSEVVSTPGYGGITYSGGSNLFIAASTENSDSRIAISTSSNGLSWSTFTDVTATSSTLEPAFTGVAAEYGTCMVLSGRVVARTTNISGISDVANWSQSLAEPERFYRDIVAFGGGFVGCGDIDLDQAVWSWPSSGAGTGTPTVLNSSTSTTRLFRIKTYNGYVITCGDNKIYAGTTRTSWEWGHFVSGVWKDFVYANGVYVFVGEGGRVHVKSDITSSLGTTIIIASVNLEAIEYINGRFIAFSGNSVFISGDGLSWKLYTSIASTTIGSGRMAIALDSNRALFAKRVPGTFTQYSGGGIDVYTFEDDTIKLSSSPVSDYAGYIKVEE